jgi:hypothetical protein
MAGLKYHLDTVSGNGLIGQSSPAHALLHQRFYVVFRGRGWPRKGRLRGRDRGHTEDRCGNERGSGGRGSAPGVHRSIVHSSHSSVSADVCRIAITPEQRGKFARSLPSINFLSE